jgi:hypothetical protein
VLQLERRAVTPILAVFLQRGLENQRDRRSHSDREPTPALSLQALRGFARPPHESRLDAAADLW